MPGVEDGSGFILFSMPQTERIYIFPSGSSIVVENVVKVRMSGGYEFLETADGKQVVVAPGWNAMRGTPAPWVFRS